MTTLKRLLLATTILSATGTWNANAAPQGDARIILAQQPAPDAEKKPDGKPPAKPGPAAKPAPAPAQQPQRPAAPARPAPPAAQQAPAPGAAQPRRPNQPPPPPATRQPQPPAAQTAPQPGQRRQPPGQPQAAPSQTSPAQASPQQDQRRDRGPRPGERTPPPPRTPQAQPQQPAAPATPPPAAQTPAQRPAVQTLPQAPAVAPVPPPASTRQRPADAPPPPSAAGAPQQQPATQAAPPPQPPAAQPQPQRIEDVRQQRREEHRDGRTIIREGDRTIIREGDRTIIRRDEADRFRGRGGRDVRVERRGNESFTIAVRPGGIQIVTVTDADGHLVRRFRRDERGREVIIIDNRPRGPRRAGGFFVQLPPPVIRIPRERYIVEADDADPAMIYETLIAPPVERIEHGYTLDEIRYSAPVRDRMPRIDVDTITFDTGSWEITASQADRLAPIADGMRRAIERNPNEVYLVEGHTDAVGADIDNLSLSDRRAESVANLLTEQFGIPPENLTTQGYGEQYLKIPTEGPERQNRRVSLRRITPLLAGQEGSPVPQ